MTAEQLSSLMHAYRDTLIGTENTIRKFCAKKNRRLAFELWLLRMCNCLEIIFSYLEKKRTSNIAGKRSWFSCENENTIETAINVFLTVITWNWQAQTVCKPLDSCQHILAFAETGWRPKEIRLKRLIKCFFFFINVMFVSLRVSIRLALCVLAKLSGNAPASSMQDARHYELRKYDPDRHESPSSSVVRASDLAVYGRSWVRSPGGLRYFLVPLSWHNKYNIFLNFI